MHPGNVASKVLFKSGTLAHGRNPSFVPPELSFRLVFPVFDTETAQSLNATWTFSLWFFFYSLTGGCESLRDRSRANLPTSPQCHGSL